VSPPKKKLDKVREALKSPANLRAVSSWVQSFAMQQIGERVLAWVAEHPGGRVELSHEDDGVAVRFFLDGKPLDVDVLRAAGPKGVD
jgi:hypothetical protein